MRKAKSEKKTAGVFGGERRTPGGEKGEKKKIGEKKRAPPFILRERGLRKKKRQKKKVPSKRAAKETTLPLRGKNQVKGSFSFAAEEEAFVSFLQERKEKGGRPLKKKKGAWRYDGKRRKKNRFPRS